MDIISEDDIIYIKREKGSKSQISNINLPPKTLLNG